MSSKAPTAISSKAAAAIYSKPAAAISAKAVAAICYFVQRQPLNISSTIS